MRSMKFKIIFVTTCFALNIGYLLADPTLLFDITFDTVEGRETYLKSQGIHDIDTFDPVKRFVGISAKSTVASALPYFSEGTTSSDWTMVKMASDKKYIELAPGTEIYIKNNVSYEFKGIDELVVPSKLPVNEQKTAGVQSAAVQKAEPVKEEKPNEDKSAQTVVDVKDSKPDMSGEKKVDPAAAKTEDDAKDKNKPVSQVPQKILTANNVVQRKTVNIKSKRWNENSDSKDKTKQDSTGKINSEIMRILKTPYEFTCDNALDIRRVMYILDYRLAQLETSDSKNKVMKAYDKKIKIGDIKINKVEGLLSAFAKYFDALPPSMNRFMLSYELYGGSANAKTMHQYNLFMQTVMPEIFFKNLCIDDVLEQFKYSIRGLNSNYISDVSKCIFGDDFNDVLTVNVINKIVNMYKCEVMGVNSSMNTSNKNNFNLSLSKIAKTKEIYKCKVKQLNAVLPVLLGRFGNVESNLRYKAISLTDSVASSIIKCPHCKEDVDKNQCPKCKNALTKNVESKTVSQETYNAISTLRNKKELEQKFKMILDPWHFLSDFLAFDCISINEYDLWMRRENINNNTKQANTTLTDDQIKKIKKDPYSDIETFCLAIAHRLILNDTGAVDRELSNIRYDDILRLLDDKLIEQMRMKIKDSDNIQASKILFANFIGKVCSTKARNEGDREKITYFRKELIENAGDLFVPVKEIVMHSFMDIDMLRSVVKNEYFIFGSQDFKYETDDIIAQDVKELIGQASKHSEENNPLVKFIDKEVDFSSAKVRMFFRAFCTTANKVINNVSIVPFNKALIKRGIVDPGSVTTNEYLDLFID